MGMLAGAEQPSVCAAGQSVGTVGAQNLWVMSVCVWIPDLRLNNLRLSEPCYDCSVQLLKPEGMEVVTEMLPSQTVWLKFTDRTKRNKKMV